MSRKCFAAPLVAALVLFMLAGSALAQEMKKYAVLPFSYNGPQKYAYFPKAFQASLNNDLEWTGHVTAASDAAVAELKSPANKAAAISALRASGIDYLVNGSIAILDKEATLSMTVTGADGETWSNKGQMSIDEISPWLDAQSRTIQGDVFNRPGYGTAEQKAKKEDIRETSAVGAAPTNSAFVMASEDRYRPDTLNPQFRYEGGVENVGRWRSQTLRFFSTSMVVADGDGDGQNEVFILTDSGISAYRFKEGKLAHLATMPLSTNTTYLRLEAVDINRDKIPEFVVGSYQTKFKNATRAPEGWIKSHILSFNGKGFDFVVKNYNRFLGVLRVPPTYMPILVAQKKGMRHLFERRIREAYVEGGEIKLGPNLAVPEYGNVYNMVYLPDGDGYRYVVIDDMHRLKVFSQTMEGLYSSDDQTYNSSAISLEISKRSAGMGPGSVDENPDIYNIPFRSLVASLSKQGKYELLLNKDLSIAAQMFERYSVYTQGEVHSLAWDGVGLNLAWKTRRIKGQVADIGIADLNNNGKDQLCVLVNTFPGGASFSKRKTIVLAYDLDL